MSSVIGGSSVALVCRNPITGELPVPTAKPPARYGAIGGARPGGFALPSYTTTRDTAKTGRKKHGFNQLEAAAKLGTNRSGLQDWEREVRPNLEAD